MAGMSILFYKGNRVKLNVDDEEKLIAIARRRGCTISQAFEESVNLKAVNLILESFNETFGKPDRKDES